MNFFNPNVNIIEEPNLLDSKDLNGKNIVVVKLSCKTRYKRIGTILKSYPESTKWVLKI